MPCRINPDYYCTEPGCMRPRETGRSYCTPCIRLARAVGRHLEFQADRDADLLDDARACEAAELEDGES